MDEQDFWIVFVVFFGVYAIFSTKRRQEALRKEAHLKRSGDGFWTDFFLFRNKELDWRLLHYPMFFAMCAWAYHREQQILPMTDLQELRLLRFLLHSLIAIVAAGIGSPFLMNGLYCLRYDLFDERAETLEQEAHEYRSQLAEIASQHKHIDEYVQIEKQSRRDEVVAYTTKYLGIASGLDKLLDEEIVRPKKPPFQLSELKPGFHLCLSTDDAFGDLTRLHTFFFLNSQRTWASRYCDIGTNSIKHDDCIFLRIGTGNNQAMWRPLDRAIQTSLLRCWGTVCNNHRDLDLAGELSVEGTTFDDLDLMHCKPRDHPIGSTFHFPRAIRMIFSKADTAAEVLSTLADGEVITLFGPRSTGVLNVWLPSEIRSQMLVKDWANGNSHNNFISAEFAADGDEPNGGSKITLHELLEACLKASYVGQSNDLYTAAKRFLNGEDCLAVGDQWAFLGEDHNANGTTPRRFLFLQILAIVSMALHCRKCLCFDAMYSAIIASSLDTKQKAEKLSQALERFLNSSAAMNIDRKPLPR